VIAIGVGAGFKLTPPVIGGAALGVVVISALWWLYFDVAAILARREHVHAEGVTQARLARDAYSYLHLPMVAGIVFFAFALETTLHHITTTLESLPAVALCTGAALYLVGNVASLWRSTGRIFRRRTLGAAVLIALIPAALNLPAVAALALVSTVCALVVAYEAIRYREHRSRIRHPELTG
jgi:low temperature requirement protein LtrA